MGKKELAPEEKIQTILKENNLKIGYQFSFPRYGGVPFLARLALKVLVYFGMRVVIFLKPQNE